MRTEERVAGVENILLGGAGIEAVFVVDDDPAELAPIVGAGDRRLRIGAGGDQMLLRQAGGADRDNRPFFQAAARAR